MALCLCGVLLCAPCAPAAEHAYVRGNTPDKGVQIKTGPGPGDTVMVQGYTIQIVEDDLPGILAGPKYAAVDVVMNQCYGGEFLAALKASPPADDWTCASACGKETSSYLFSLVPPDVKGAVDDFTRAWREDGLIKPPTGMKQHFNTALNGNDGAKILADRYGPKRTVVHEIVIKMKQIGNYEGIDPLTMQKMIIFGPKPGTDNTPHYFEVVYGENNNVKGWWFLASQNRKDFFGNDAGSWLQITPKPGPDPGGKWVWNGKEYDYSSRYPDGTEHPQYDSKGAASDNRTLALPDPNPDGVQQYAVLVQWDEPKGNDKKTATFAGDISRMYDMLVNTYAVPAANIVVLYDSGKYADGTANLPAFTLEPGPMGAKTEDLAQVPITRPTGFVNDGKSQFQHAVNGDLFGAKPDFAKSRLLVYFSGHGGRNNVKKMKVGYNADPNYIVMLLPEGATDEDGNTTINGFEARGEFEQNLLSSLVSTNNDDLSDAGILYNTNNILDDIHDSQILIQISTTRVIPFGVQLVVNGYTNPVSLLPVSDTNAVVYDLDAFVPGLLTNTYTYQVSVPTLALYNPTASGTNPGVIGLDFQGLPPTSFEPGLVAAVILRGGAQELAYITPDVTTTSALSAQDFGGGILVTWPAGQIGYNILENDDLTTSNWVRVNNPATGMPEVTGTADANLPMGPNWAFFAYTVNQRFFKLVPASP